MKSALLGRANAATLKSSNFNELTHVTNTALRNKISPALVLCLVAAPRLHALPIVTNYSTILCATVTHPMKLAFGTNGALYVGRDNSGSGGGVFDAVKIHRIGVGGLPVNRLVVVSEARPCLQLFAANRTLLTANFTTVRWGAPVVAGPGDAFWGTDLYSVNTNGELIRITLSGNGTVVGSGFGDKPAPGISELALDPDHELHYSHHSEDRVLRIALNTTPFPQPTHA